MVAIASLMVVPSLATVFSSYEVHSRSGKPITTTVIIWLIPTIIIIIKFGDIIVGVSLTINVGVWVILVSITLITIIRSIIILVILNVVCVIIIIIIIVVAVIIWWIGAVSLVAIVVVVGTVVGIRMVPGFWPIISPPALFVIFLILVIFEQFGHCLYRLNLAASPCLDYLFIVRIR